MSTQQTREITVYATRGGTTAKIITDATTWGELRPLVQKQGFDLSSLLAAESFTKHDLVNDLALLPIENFRLFLRPKQTKSGAEMSYKELRAAISFLIGQDGEKAANHFNQERNYTTKGTEILRDLYNSYGKKGAKAAKAVKEVKAAKKADKKVGKKANKASKKVVKVVKVSAQQVELDSIISRLRDLPKTSAIEDAISLLVGGTTVKKVDNSAQIAAEAKAKAEREALEREAREMGY